MVAMFPDSGVPASDAKNSTDPYTTCEELWYSTSRCQPRFDPAAANAVLSELTALINAGEVTYNCGLLNQMQLAVRYIVQRGIPHGASLYGGPANYSGAFDPPLTRYNNYLTVTLVPNVDNSGPVQLNLSGLGFALLLRNDQAQLEKQDLRAGVPFIASYINGLWYHVGLCQSQVPLFVKGSVDVWIRWDGNDVTGDGSANSPDKAFRTIKGAWAAVGSRYLASPMFSIHMKLGIPGDYEGGVVFSFGSPVTLTGDVGNPNAYRLKPADLGGGTQFSPMAARAMADFRVYGVTFVMDVPSCMGFRTQDSNCAAYNCRWEVLAENPTGACLSIYGGSFNSSDPSTLFFIGNGHQINHIIEVLYGATFIAAIILSTPVVYHMENFNIVHCGLAAFALSTMHWNTAAILNAPGTVGMEYVVDENSIINMGTLVPPGTITGTTSSGGQYIP